MSSKDVQVMHAQYSNNGANEVQKSQSQNSSTVKIYSTDSHRKNTLNTRHHRTNSKALAMEEKWIHLPARITFDTLSSELSNEAQTMLREVKAFLGNRTDIVRIRIEGHADGRGRAKTNRRLGLERAISVLNFWVHELQMPSDLFMILSHGDTRPVTSETSRLDRRQNRRVEFSILIRRPIKEDE